MVEVECENPDQVIEATEAGASVVMLDNMKPDQVAECVALVRSTLAGSNGAAGSVLVEVSGGVTIETAPDFARAGADLISVGALTHSAPVLDIGLDLSSADVSPSESRASSGDGIRARSEGAP